MKRKYCLMLLLAAACLISSLALADSFTADYEKFMRPL